MEHRGTVRRDLAAVSRTLRWVWPAAVAVPAALYFLSGVYVLKPEEIGVVRRFGKVTAPRVAPGMHYRLPWPVDALDRVRVREVRRMSVGFRLIEKEKGAAPKPLESQFLTGDTNIIDIRMIVQYIVEDPAKYLFNVEGARWLVRKAAEAALVEKLAGMGVDEVLTTGKPEIQAYVRERIQQALDEYGTGLHINQATLREVRPPEEVAPAFRDVASAREDRQRKINDADGYRNEVLSLAEGEREKTITAADAGRGVRISRARGDADRFLSMLAEYEKAPRITAERIYIEGMEEILPNARKYILGGDERSTGSLRMMIFGTP